MIRESFLRRDALAWFLVLTLFPSHHRWVLTRVAKGAFCPDPQAACGVALR